MLDKGEYYLLYNQQPVNELLASLIAPADPTVSLLIQQCFKQTTTGVQINVIQ